MPEKLGNGGHSYEKYDPNTGKYVTDGVENKYYNNPKEIISDSIKLSREELKDYLNNVVQNEELNAMFKESKQYEKYTKPVTEMTTEELSIEIKEHKKWLQQNNIDLKFKCMDSDLKLKCANLREMHRLFEKYPFFKNLKHPIVIKDRKMTSRYADARMCNTNLKKKGRYIFISSQFSFCDSIRFNSNEFFDYEQTINSHKKDIKTKFHPDCLEEKIANSSFTHEFGHMLAARFIYEGLPDNVKNKEGVLITSVTEHNYLVQLWNNAKEKFHDEALSEIKQIYSQDNSDYGLVGFSEDMSRYAQKKGPVEWFAETFSSLECGKPTKSALSMQKWLEEKTKKLRGI